MDNDLDSVINFLNDADIKMHIQPQKKISPPALYKTKIFIMRIRAREKEEKIATNKGIPPTVNEKQQIDATMEGMVKESMNHRRRRMRREQS